ncbi:toll-like receptor 2 [Salarias fasciatus]|uniref:toll-like receptor 2 n=1 Tax=Salarias fasciatus TaxID=181472 RepID=UPI001176B2CA|nr:toll-like receptor 2 [Salarias fasciatus]
MKCVVLLLVAQSFSLVPPRCLRCEGTSCDCSRQNLTRVPAAASPLVSDLDLSFNRLEEILKHDFLTYGSLKALLMNNNEIRSVQDEALVPLIRLERLDLSHNRLETLSSAWFQKLSSLLYLNLLGNKYTTVGDGNVFQGLRRLRILQVGGASLQSVKRGHFSGLSDVDQLFFDGRNLQEYEEGGLKETGPIGLVTLDLNGVFARNPAIVRSILSDVVYPNTTLTFTDTSFLRKTLVSPFGFAANLGATSIVFRNVNMSVAACKEILNLLSRSNLTSLTLDGVQMLQTHETASLDQLQMHSLEAIVLKNIEVTSFYNFPSLVFLKSLMTLARRVSLLNSNWFAIPCEVSIDFTELQFLDISDNIFSDLTLSELMCYGGGVLLGLRTLNVSRNHLRSVSSRLFAELPKLQNIDMSGNRLKDMPECCRWPDSLRFLNLSSCHLTAVTRCLPPSLRVLDLSNNHLTEFDTELPFLTHLDVSGNKIGNLPAGGLYPRLTVLSVQNNNLQKLSSKDLQAYKALRRLKAGENPYFCSCEFVAFMTGGRMNHRKLLGGELDFYVCSSPDAERGRRVSDVRLPAFRCHTASALAALCSGILGVCLLAAAAWRRFSVGWYIRMTCAWLRAKRKPRLKKGPPQYDAFVSYSDMDSAWVETHLVPELEQSHPPVRLCLHKRDFLPGGWILDNIMDAIEKSHRTLFVLSRHFVRSEWCVYELDYTHFRLFDQNDDTVVLILLEPIDKRTIPKKFCRLRRAMNSRTYLEWPADGGQLAAFWKRLRAAIQRHD